MNLLEKIITNRRGRKHYMLLSTALCLSLGLYACGNKDLVHVKDAFKKPIAIEKEMDDETSHLAQTLNLDGQPESLALDDQIGEIGAPPDSSGKFAGLNPKNMFGTELSSNEQRLARLERAVQDMRNDFDLVKPSIQRLMGIEGDMQKLLRELERLNNSVPASASAPVKKANPKPSTTKSSAAPKPAPQETPTVTKTPPPVTGKASVFDVRTGEHAGKTRIVMDTNTKTPFSVDIDNNEKIMVIDLPNAQWDSAMTKNFGASPYVSSYKVEDSGDGKIVIFQLKKNAKILYKEDLKGLSGDARRIVIDVGDV